MASSILRSFSNLLALSSGHSIESMKVTSLTRYPVKGLGPSSLDSVHIQASETFPDDRRFALLKTAWADEFNSDEPDWIHKEKFVCAFTDPELLSRYECQYRIVGSNGRSWGEPWDDLDGGDDQSDENNLSPCARTRRVLTLWERDNEINSGRHFSSPPVLGPVDLASELGQDDATKFFSKISGQDVVCVTADPSAEQGLPHTHQFGNTRSGIKARGDTRTVHLVNAATVRQFSEAIGSPLSPSRFRPNIVVDNLEPWAEFGMVGKTISLEGGSLVLQVISTTVRCEGVGIDPQNPTSGKLDIPKLLVKHFPERGPFFGVYAQIRQGGTLKVGDTLVVDGTAVNTEK